MIEQEDNEKIDKFMTTNKFELAYCFARNADFKPKFLAQLSRISGDKEMLKAKFADAMKHYKRTIGFLEPSYVLQKFIEKGQIAFNIDYLKELHARGKADKYHIRLLVNCLLEKKKSSELQKWFAQLDSSDSEFAELTINACLEYGETDLAKQLAHDSKRTEFYVKIIIENFFSYQDQVDAKQVQAETDKILEHISNISSPKGSIVAWRLRKQNLLEYGPVLMRYNSPGVFKLVRDYISFFLEQSKKRNSILERSSGFPESFDKSARNTNLSRATGSSRESALSQVTNEDLSLRDLLQLYRQFEPEFETETEQLIKFLGKNLRNLPRSEKGYICEFIIEYYADQYCALREKIRSLWLETVKSTRKRSSVHKIDKLPNTREIVNRSDHLNMKKKSKIEISGELNRTAPFPQLQTSSFDLPLENIEIEDKRIDWVKSVTTDENIKTKLTRIEVEIESLLMDQEIIRLVDLHYFLILFAQCQMRKPKLVIYDLLEMKMEKLEDEFANQCIDECFDFCQNHASDYGKFLLKNIYRWSNFFKINQKNILFFIIKFFLWL